MGLSPLLPLLARVRSLRHGFTTVITGIRALGPGDNRAKEKAFNDSPILSSVTIRKRRQLFLVRIVELKVGCRSMRQYENTKK
ncbi:hypothetical protein PIB30_021240 [Stylosanthes scabra]|uniref:Secreted protein n=1 Tax=Stylosanthes scabra TaxID=79078 RepID=A0ABU6W8X7_9FABA|nr:hypothetical protein [Stylosanthes scabra]